MREAAETEKRTREMATADIKRIQSECNANIAKVRQDAKEQVEKHQRKTGELQQTLDVRDATIRQMREEEIPKLKSEIKVLKHENELLDQFREKSLTRIEADVAANNKSVTEYESWQQRIMGRE